ncbi:DNA binding, putative isoform 1 [Quillaja saponaria]|uniref:DNA binding, putative isoform 1 n=1 Tax=Quillaja saponaria TaxID=32244 RepID=A0AAD7Q519_QUISA|nr:DNA binding, putative isoform 1 [Quillaja saponaria]
MNVLNWMKFSTHNVNLGVEKAVNIVSSLLLEKGPCIKEGEAEKNLRDPLLESSRQATPKENRGHEFQEQTPEVQISCRNFTTTETLEQSQAITEAEVMSAPNGISSTNTGSHSSESKTKEETPVNVNVYEAQLSGSSQKKSKPTLDRINLESWEGAPKTCVKPETTATVTIPQLGTSYSRYCFWTVESLVLPRTINIYPCYCPCLS